MVFSKDLVLFSAHCITGKEKDPETSTKTEIGNHIFSVACGDVVSCCVHLSKDKTFQPYIAQQDFIRDKNSNFTFFDVRFQKMFSSFQN